MVRKIRKGNVGLSGIRAQDFGLRNGDCKAMRMEECPGNLHKRLKGGWGTPNQHKIICKEDTRHQLITKGQPMGCVVERLAKAVYIQPK